MKKPVQYLLVGLPYSGKTTLAKILQDNLGFAHINIDQLKSEAGFGDVGDDDVPDKVWNDIFATADKLIVKYLSEGKNLANEYAWVTKEWRDRATNIAREAGFETKIIYLKIELEEIKNRWFKNSQKKERFHWPENEFKGYIRDFEEPGENESVVIYDQSIPAEVWIEQNLTKII